MICQRLRGDDGVRAGRHVGDGGQRDLVHDRAGALQRRRGALDGGAYVRRGRLEKERAQQSHAQSFDVTGERAEIVRHGQHARRGVGRVVARHHTQQERGVADGARHGADVIHRPRERQHARTTHPPVRRLEARDAAE